MRRSAKITLGAAGAAAVLWIGAALIVPRLVDADAFRGRVEERLGRILGRQVRLGTLRLSLWTGISVRAGSLSIAGSPSLEAERVRVGLAVWPLLRGEAQPRWMAVEGADVRLGEATILREASLRCRIGSKDGKASRLRGRFEAVVVPMREAPRGEIDFDARVEGDRVTVESFAARAGPHVFEAKATVEGLRSGALRGELEGSARVAGLTITGIRAKGRVERAGLRIEEGGFRIHGGTGTVHGLVRVQEPGVPFRLESEVGGVDVESLSREVLAAAGGALEGTGSATLAVEGRADAPSIAKALEGTASVEIRDGALRSVGLLRQVASALEKAGGRGVGRDETPFETMAASFRLRDGLAQTEDLRVRSTDLDLDGTGAIDLAGPLRLDVRTAFSPESSALLVARTPQLKIRVGEDGRLTIPMKLRGTIESPRVEIDVDKLLEEGLRDQIREKKQGLLRRLLGR
jgi:uncharacterized protein involved in outer membrane biogenesis